MNNSKHIAFKSWLTGISLATALCGSAHALTLSDEPLFISSAIDPNVFFEVDDSGSMDWDVLTKQHWHFCAYDYASCGWFVDNGLWRSYNGWGYSYFIYVFDNSDDAYSNGCGSSLYGCGTSLAANTPYQSDWRILSSDLNVVYYDPTQSYSPWDGPCDTSGNGCTNASFSAARSNPMNGEAGYGDTRNLDGFTYEVWTDDRGFDGTDGPHGEGSINANTTPNGLVDLWDEHTTYTVNGSSIQYYTTTYSPDSSGLNPSYSTTTTLTSTDTICHAGGAVCRTVADELQNIANWYQYHRRRSFVAKSAIATVVSDNPDFRYGLSVINNYTSLFTEVPAASVSNYNSHNEQLLEDLFAFDWPAMGTPLRQGLERTGQYFDNTLGSGYTDPIIDTCQKNFAVLFTDGYWNGSDPSVGDSDGDGLDETLADVAHYFYVNDLSPFANEVNADSWDTATHQHLVSFTVAFGVQGNLVDSDGDGWPDGGLTESSDWGNPYCSDCPEKIDDMWHAAYNSRGTFVSAQTPGEVASALQEALDEVVNRTSSASSVALSTGHISTDSQLFQAQFITTDWHGKLLAIPVQSGGSLGTETADAGQRIPDYDSRVILTTNDSTATGVAFRWNNLSSTQQDVLNRDMAGTLDSLGQDRLNWLRGDQTNENNNTGFRERNDSVLGDIVNSAPFFVGAPPYLYPDDWGTGSAETPYSTFVSNKQNRTKMVYVGANDGMLHGFKGEGSGDLLVETLAYVPTPVYENLSALTAPNYSHQYYVDGSPVVIDAFFNSNWHSVLLGGMRAGGQGVYALDVTDPASFSESGTVPEDIVLWEFTDNDDPDMGYVFGPPTLGRMADGSWAAIIHNGYNNTENDGTGTVSSTGTAVLFIVDASDGSIIQKIDTSVGDPNDPNGLSQAVAVDTNNDFIVDAIYAGDLYGNLWKFDVSASNPNQWDVAYGNGNNKSPLFEASLTGNVKQPITTRPTVGYAYGRDGVMVYFGTGQYLGDPDLSDTTQQTFYGIIDDGDTVSGRSALLQQTLVELGNYRYYDSPQDLADTDEGWYIDLPATGERVASNPILRAGRIIFVTIIPDGNSCSSGGSAWLMEVDAADGGPLDAPPFDLNGDGIFNEDDLLDTDGDGVGDTVPTGKVSTEGIIPSPAITIEEEVEYKYTPGSTGNIETTVENSGVSVGRQSWRELK